MHCICKSGLLIFILYFIKMLKSKNYCNFFISFGKIEVYSNLIAFSANSMCSRKNLNVQSQMF